MTGIDGNCLGAASVARIAAPRLRGAGRDLDAAAALDVGALDGEGRREASVLVEAVNRRAGEVRDRIVAVERERGGERAGT